MTLGKFELYVITAACWTITQCAKLWWHLNCSLNRKSLLLWRVCGRNFPCDTLPLKSFETHFHFLSEPSLLGRKAPVMILMSLHEQKIILLCWKTEKNILWEEQDYKERTRCRDNFLVKSFFLICIKVCLIIHFISSS